MVTLSCDATRHNGVTLVTGHLEHDGETPRRVRVASELDGPLWPPRRRGVPARGWTADGFECVLAPGETRAIGAASPAPPAESPLVVAETEPVEDDPDGFEPRVSVPDAEPNARDVLRKLGSPRPPRDAVPLSGGTLSPTVGDDGSPAANSSIGPDADSGPNPSGGTDSERHRAAGVAPGRDATGSEEDCDRADRIGQTDEPAGCSAGDDTVGPEHACDEATADDAGGDARAGEFADGGPDDHEARADAASSGSDGGPGNTADAATDGPADVEAWLAALEDRVAAAEDLSPETRLPVAADLLQRIDVPDADDPEAAFERDAERLRAFAARASSLAERVEAVTLPVAELDRLR